MQSLTKTVYIEVHAQGSLSFLNVGVYSSYGQWLCIDRRESSAQGQFGHYYNASWHTYRRTGSPYYEKLLKYLCMFDIPRAGFLVSCRLLYVRYLLAVRPKFFFGVTSRFCSVGFPERL